MKSTLIYFKILVLTSLLSILNFILPISSSVLGYQLPGWSWIIVFLVSVYYIIFIIKKSFFTLNIWLPWGFLLLIYLVIDSSFVALQGTIQFIVPIMVGYVTGSLNYNNNIFLKIINYFKYLIIMVLLSVSLISIVRYGFLGAAPAMYAHFASIAGVLVISLYFSTKKFKYLLYFGLVSTIPIMSVTRMGIFIMFLIPLINFYKFLSLNKIVLIFLLLPIGLFIFNLPSVQKKMFLDGKGNLSEIQYSSDNLNTNGRSYINKALIEEFNKNPFLGNGTRADYFIFKQKGWELTESHNEYLQILVCYGILGLFIFFLSLYFQFKKITKLKILSENEKIIKSIILTFMPVLLIFMISDPILRYTSSFMNYFFALIGVLFAINKQNLKIINYNNDNNSSYPII